MNSCQCLGRVKRPAAVETLEERSAGQGSEQAENRQAGRPGADLFERAFGGADGVVIHAEDEGSDGIDVALRQALEHGGIFFRLVEALVDVFQVGGIDRLHADEDPLAAGGGNEVDEFLIAEEVGADLSDPIDLRAGGDDIAQQRFGALEIDGEIVVDEKDGDLAAFFSGARLEQQEFVDDAFVGAEADGVAEESGDGAELAAVGATASGLDGNDAERSPAFADFCSQRASPIWVRD